MITTVVLFTILALSAQAHVSIWNPGFYGQKSEMVHTIPLRDMKFDEWWFHSYLNDPPPEGEFALIPSGGVFHGDVSCLWANTSGPSAFAPGDDDGKTDHWGKSDDNGGSLHTRDKPGTPSDQLRGVRGCGLAIAYESDQHKIKPEDFTVISVNYTCPWLRDTEFPIPAGLPPCPPGGCHCMWGWVHSQDAGISEVYLHPMKCNVTGTLGSVPIPKPLPARKCPVDMNNCTKAAKQMHFWMNLEGNNNFQSPDDPPFYNGDYGFANGAQNDIWDKDDGSLWNDKYCDWADRPTWYKGSWKGWPRTTWEQDPKPIEVDEEEHPPIPLRVGCSAPGKPVVPYVSSDQYVFNASSSDADVAGDTPHAKKFVEVISAFRSQFGAPPVKWNSTLAAKQQENLKACQFWGADDISMHNILVKDDVSRLTLGDVFAQWAGQWTEHVNGKGKDVLDDFTRMVWLDAADIGCAWTLDCPGNEDWKYLHWVNCQYGPKANVDGEYAAKVPDFQPDKVLPNSTGPQDVAPVSVTSAVDAKPTIAGRQPAQ